MFKKRRKKVSPNEVVLGAPIFGNDPGLLVQSPVGQVTLHTEVREEVRNPMEVAFQQGLEYFAIIEGLTQMKIPFRIAIGSPELILPPAMEAIEEGGFRTIKFPRLNSRLATYIRDVAIRPIRDMILVNPDLKDQGIPEEIDGCRIVFSDSGEGGRTLYSGETLLVSDEVSYEKTFTTDLNQHFHHISFTKKKIKYIKTNNFQIS